MPTDTAGGAPVQEGGCSGDSGGGVVAIEDIADVVENLIEAAGGELPVGAETVVHGLQSLSEYIHTARAEISAIRPDDVKTEFIPQATDELDAIVAATADATNSIMDAVEVVEDVMGRADGDDSAKLMDATTKIYEACTFQDITGQRITKVVTMLKHIEDKIDVMLGHMPADMLAAKKDDPSAKKDGGVTDEDLLNGPGLDGDAKSQEDIDALLASFD